MATRLSRRAIAHYTADRLHAGDGTVVAQLAAYLIDTKRTNEVDIIVRDIESALEQLGVVVADVTTARDLSVELERHVADFVKTIAGASEVHIRSTTDEALLGGVRIRTSRTEYDASARRQLTKLQAMKV